MGRRYLPIRVCSAHKSSIKFGYLDQIYTCQGLKSFFKAFSNNGYAVLSRKNGICFSWERTENYGDWQEKDRSVLLALLREQFKDPRFNQYCYVYWNPCPPRHGCFVKLLRDAGFVVLEARRLIQLYDMLLQQERSEPAAAELMEGEGFVDLVDFVKGSKKEAS